MSALTETPLADGVVRAAIERAIADLAPFREDSEKIAGLIRTLAAALPNGETRLEKQDSIIAMREIQKAADLPPEVRDRAATLGRELQSGYLRERSPAAHAVWKAARERAGLPS